MHPESLALPWSVKICGVTTVPDALAVAAAGAGAIGLNFHSRSMRSVPLPAVPAIVSAVGDYPVCSVAVFVNEQPERIRQIAGGNRIGWIQLNGDENPAILQDLAGLRVLKVIRLAAGGESALVATAALWAAAGAAGIVIDSPRRQRPRSDDEGDGEDPARPPTSRETPASNAQDSGGGAEPAMDWNAVGRILERVPIPVVLSGGLGPGNVAEAIRRSGVTAVDVAGGVEGFPGRQDLAQVAHFLGEAKAGFLDSAGLRAQAR